MISYGPTLLKIQNVGLTYGDKVILRDVNADIQEIERDSGKGQIVGFLGPSGIGKTQLFRIIAGLNQPTTGSVIIDGGKTAQPGLVGVVAQGYPLFNHRTVFSNLMLAAERKYPSNEAHDKVMSYLQEFDLADKMNLYPAQLSGGQRQRVAILQQVLCSQHFLLFDEPFSGLDLVMLEKTAALLQKISNMDEKNVMVIVSHDVTATIGIADHVWLLGRDRDGQGNIIPGARIVENYDLVERGLCWHPEITTTPEFMFFVSEVKKRFRSL